MTDSYFLPVFDLQFMNVPLFRNVTMKCLTEIAGVNVSQYEQQFVVLFTLAMTQLKQVGVDLLQRFAFCLTKKL